MNHEITKQWGSERADTHINKIVDAVASALGGRSV